MRCIKSKHQLQLLPFLVLALLTLSLPARAENLKPFIMGNPPAGGMSLNDVTNLVELQLETQGFVVAGQYSPYPSAMVIVVTDDALKMAAARAQNGGFGAGERVAITSVGGNLQVSYVNPQYMGVAYGMGDLGLVSKQMANALGAQFTFGSKNGIDSKALGPGNYHYMMGMPYFGDVDRLAKYPSYAVGVATVERNLAAHAGGTTKVYRIDLPGKQVSVFGVAIDKGDPKLHIIDTDKKIMDIIDYGPNRATAFLPYEMIVEGDKAYALPARYRIPLCFPDTAMMGEHGFTKIMSAPRGIKRALKAVAAMPEGQSDQSVQ